MKKQISYKIVSVIFSVLVVCFAIAFYTIAWEEPSAPPPGGDIPAPLNTGPIGQSKEGGLILNTGGAQYGLIVDQGNVGIGTVTPSEKLDVSGQIHATEDICTDAGGGVCLSTVGGGGGGAIQTDQVVGSTNISYNSTAWGDMPGMTITMDTTGGDVLLMFSARMRTGNDSYGGYIRLLVDGVKRHVIGWEPGENSDDQTPAMQWLEKGLSVGSHTFRIQWKKESPIIYQDGASFPRVFTAIEL